MRLLTNILACIAALIVSAQSSSPNVGSGKTSHDPNSIRDNEEFLRLLLFLASHTADHLIHLKKQAKSHRVTTTPSADDIVPQARIDFADQRPKQEIASPPSQHRQYGRHMYGPHEKASGSERYAHDQRPYGAAYHDHKHLSGPYEVATVDEYVTPSYGSYGDYYAPERRNNDRNLVEEKQSEHDPSLKPRAKDDDIPIEIEARALFDDPKNDTKQNDSLVNNFGTTEQSESTTSSSQEAKTISSKSQSTSSSAENEAGGSTSGIDDAGESKTDANHDLGLGVTNATAVVSKLQSMSSEIIGKVQNAAKVASNLATNETETSVDTVAGKDLKDQTNGLLDTLVPNQAGDVLLKANSASGLLNHKSLLANPTGAISGVNDGSHMIGEMTNTAHKTGGTIVKTIVEPVSSIADGTTGNAAKLLGDLTNVGLNVAGSDDKLGKRKSESKSPLESNFRRAASSLMDPSGISHISSNFMGSLPLFRSFPDISDESSELKKPRLSTTPSKNSQTHFTDSQTILNEDNNDRQGHSTRGHDKTRVFLDDDRTISEKTTDEKTGKLNLDYFASQFADALRPVQST